jgi:carboxymethylenebutenolidase
LFGGDDSGIPVDSVRNFEGTLERLRKNYEIEIYPRARNAFANPSGRNYNPVVAEEAWEKTTGFLNLHLSIANEQSD